MIRNSPTYLHFLDRELRRAEGANYDDLKILHSIIFAVINSTTYCYSSASLLLESSEMFPLSIDLVLQLEKLAVVKFIANEFSFDEFIDSRRKIYAHRADRYPMYFNDGGERFWPISPVLVKTSTTSILRSEITSWIDTPSQGVGLTKESYEAGSLRAFSKILHEQKEKAITLDLILSKDQLSVDTLRRKAGRLISYFYTKRYVDLFRGDILCHLPQLSFYDALSIDPIVNSYFLIGTVLRCLDIPSFFFRNGVFNPVLFLEFLSSKSFKHFQTEFISTIHGLKELSKYGGISDITRAGKYYETFFSFTTPFDPKISIESILPRVYSRLYGVAAKLSRAEEAFSETYEMSRMSLTRNKKVLVVATTAVETRILLTTLETAGLVPSPISHEKTTFWNCSVLGNSEVFVLKIDEMGTSKPSGSLLSIYDGVKSLRPDYVIMVGIAFGLKRDRQKIGDILISRELEDYDSKKKTEKGDIQRGHRIPAGATLLNRFDNSSLQYMDCATELGFIISGDVLVDSKPFVDELTKSFPEAIGAEMEGTGLQSSCHRDNKEWILIKGICDWGYDKQNSNKEKDQQTAITNVSKFLVYTMMNFEF